MQLAESCPAAPGMAAGIFSVKEPGNMRVHCGMRFADTRPATGSG